MDKLKKSRIILIICIVLMILAIVPSFVVDEYDYSKLDLSKDQNKIALDGDVSYYVYEKQSGKNTIDFEFELFNLTEETIEDIKIYFVLRDSKNEEEYFYTEETISLESRLSVEQNFTGECDDTDYSTIQLTIQIGDGEEFRAAQIDDLVKTNPIVGISGMVFFVMLACVIVLSIRVGKISKKQLEAEVKAYEQRADEIVDIEIQKEKAMLEREQLANDAMRQNIENKVEQPKSVKCEYCGNPVEPNEDRCKVCGAIVRKD